MWIARDKNRELWLYDEKPTREEKYSCWINKSSITNEGIGTLDDTMFPELKWEDEPMEVDLVPKGKTNKTDITVTRENIIFNDSYWTNMCNTTAMAAMAAIIEKWNNIYLDSVIEEVCELSVAYANTLIKKLKSKELEKNSK